MTEGVYPVRQGVDRRELLRWGGAALLGIPLLAACGGNGGSPGSAGAPGEVRRGGRLTVGMITAGRTETLDVRKGFTLPDTARNYQLYEGLYALDSNNKPVPALAASGEHNAEATLWTFRIRDGVQFHNGKPLTAEDVLYTIRSWASEESYFNPVVGPLIDFAALRTRDPMTVEVPLHSGIAELPSLLAYYTAGVIPDGFTDFDTPVGTGPFVYESFQPGTRSVFSANKNYWQEGKPYVDELVINSSFSDDEARLNALLAQQIDVAPQLPFTQARQYSGGNQFRVSVGNGPQCQMFYMRVDEGPARDVRVRQAMRLLIDRDAMIQNVLAGFGELGNDLPGYGLEYFAGDLTRSRDVDQARSLLRAAGQRDLRIELITSPITAGFVESATLLKQQAAEGGVTVDITRQDPSVFFTDAGGYMRNTFSQDYWTLIPSLTAFYLQGLVTDAPYNVTHWGGAAADGQVRAAIAETDPVRAADRWRDVQQAQFDEGGYIIWSAQPYIDGYRNAVQGIEATPSGFANNYDFKSAWLTQ